MTQEEMESLAEYVCEISIAHHYKNIKFVRITCEESNFRYKITAPCFSEGCYYIVRPIPSLPVNREKGGRKKRIPLGLYGGMECLGLANTSLAGIHRCKEIIAKTSHRYPTVTPEGITHWKTPSGTVRFDLDLEKYTGDDIWEDGEPIREWIIKPIKAV